MSTAVRRFPAAIVVCLMVLPSVTAGALLLQQWLVAAAAGVLAACNLGFAILIHKDCVLDAHADGTHSGTLAATLAVTRGPESAKAHVDRLFAALPRTVEGAGYIYVIVFSTGVIKVGQTIHPRQRLGQHRSEAAAYGIAVVDMWLSPPHASYLANEARLIRYCARRGTRARSEYFAGANPTAVVAYASALPMEVLPA